MAKDDERLIIDVARLSRDGEELSGALDSSVFGFEDSYLKPFAGLRYELGAMLFGSELLLRGKLEQDFTGVCSRCGKDFDFTVKVPDFTASFEVAENTAFIDVTEEIRQSLLLAVPNYPLCDPSCPGITQKTQPVNDLRWGALDGLEVIEKKKDL